MKNKRIIILLAISVVALGIYSPSILACNALVVGNKASADGSVLFGHVEQNGGRYILNFRKIPRRQYEKGSLVTLRNGGTLPQVEETYAFLWSQNPSLVFSDTYINEWGVAISSNACPSREDSLRKLVERGDIVDGGIDYMLRRLIVERVKTAKDGVMLAGELIEKFGYPALGRTLTIADPNEAWLLSMVRGKHWVAQRVPDDAVVILPNVYIIGEIDLEDTDNFLASPDIIDYAVQRGWYDPECGEPFSFRSAYGPPGSAGRIDPRQQRAQNLVLGKDAEPSDGEPLPFSIEPDHKLSVQDIIRILRDHGDEKGRGRLCNSSSQEAAVFQLRNWLPKEIGCIYWKTSAEPCTSVLLPWYIGITETPASYFKSVSVDSQISLDYQFKPPADTFTPDESFDWWTFKNLQDKANSNYVENIKTIRNTWDPFENRIFSAQEETERKALELFEEDPNEAKFFITDYSASLAREASEIAKTLAKTFAKK